jgi:hypothetical protein
MEAASYRSTIKRLPVTETASVLRTPLSAQL